MEMDEIMIGFSVAAYSLLFLVILLAQIPFCSFYVENLFVKENKRQRSFFPRFFSLCMHIATHIPDKICHLHLNASTEKNPFLCTLLL